MIVLLWSRNYKFEKDGMDSVCELLCDVFRKFSVMMFFIIKISMNCLDFFVKFLFGCFLFF